METETLIRVCSARGATLIPDGLQLRVQGWSRLDSKSREALRSRKSEVLGYLRQKYGVEPHPLSEWRQAGIPEWRGILQESINDGDRKREEYARWMLREILLDSQYREHE